MKNKEKVALAKQLIGLGESEIYTHQENAVTYRMLVLFRGQGLFYAEDDKCLVFDKFSARDAKLCMEEVDKWLDGSAFADREQVKVNLRKYYKYFYKDALDVEE